MPGQIEIVPVSKRADCGDVNGSALDQGEPPRLSWRLFGLITKNRVKPVTPGQGFVGGGERAPTAEELDLLNRIVGAGQ